MSRVTIYNTHITYLLDLNECNVNTPPWEKTPQPQRDRRDVASLIGSQGVFDTSWEATLSIDMDIAPHRSLG